MTFPTDVSVTSAIRRSAILAVVDAPLWAANNPHVTEANVRADDSAN